MINDKLKKIMKGISKSLTGILGGIAQGMIYGNATISNGGGIVIKGVLR